MLYLITCCTPDLDDNLSQPVEMNLGRHGRAVIPASLREALMVEQGDALVTHQQLGLLMLEKPRQIRQWLKERFVQVPGEREPGDEMISERQLEGSQGD